MKLKFEIPYNFDPNFINALLACGINEDSIAFIYVAPFPEDYQTILRAEPYPFSSLTRAEYVEHILKINKFFPGKLQLLLQNKEKLLSDDQLKWYIKLGFTAFCCGNPQQAEMIKKLNNKLEVIGSIVLHIDKKTLESNPYYQQYFDYFVLDFKFSRKLHEIKLLPENKKYMILANAICSNKCDGDHHWNVKTRNEPIKCPGKFGVDHADFAETTLIRPMDLKYFMPYIDVFKIQDRSWTTNEIIRDIILYTTDYSLYPGIEYDENLYTTF